jgi:hypothetical protein
MSQISHSRAKDRTGPVQMPDNHLFRFRFWEWFGETETETETETNKVDAGF